VTTRPSRCDRCVYWHRTGEKYGECRIDPPDVQAEEIHPYAPEELELPGERAAWGWWPLTHEHDWCGAFDDGEDDGEGGE
jgi:hypothetical protein